MNTLFRLRRIKYRRLPALIGQKITIPALAQVEEPILKAISSAVAGAFRLNNSVDDLTQIMGKYGFLDVTFASHEQLLTPADKINRDVIRELGYSPRPEDPKTDWLSERGCLEMLLEDMVEQGTLLRLFLNSKWSENSLERYAQHLKARKSSGQTIAEKTIEWFPVTFTVEDACLSNSDAVWLVKHFYL